MPLTVSGGLRALTLFSAPTGTRARGLVRYQKNVVIGPAVVRGREAGADLTRQLDRAVLREAADAAEQRREIFPVHVLHREERVPLEALDVVHAADVGM